MLDVNLKRSFMHPHVLEELIDLKFNHEEMNFAEMKVDLILYCILVNGLDKTKGEKIDKIKKEMLPLIKILKEIFCEFDKNEIHKERTFIFPLRSRADCGGYFYIISQKDMLRYNYGVVDDIKSMSLHSATNIDGKDKRRNKYEIVLGESLYEIVLGKALYENGKEYKL